MEKRINRSLCAMSAAAALVCSLLIFFVMQAAATAQMHRSVHESVQTLAGVFDSAQIEPQQLALKAGGQRVTWVGADGAVLYDTAGATQNHADRPEIADAVKNGFGEDTRLSDTLREQTYYYALRLEDGSVLRVSMEIDSLYTQLLGCVPFFLLAAAAVTVLSTFASAALTRRLMAPVEAIDVEHPLESDAYEELTPLLRRIDRQNRQLGARVDEVRAMRDELSDVMETMTEGLIVLNSEGNILSINRSALAALGCEKDVVLGAPLLTACRNDTFVALAHAAQKGESMEALLPREGRSYLASLSQAAQGGAILLLIDVTDRTQAERMRREFSANVSHELKTPLQSILGYAELLKNGVVKEGDRAAFYENIYGECRRMIALVQDIIDLSRLDEGAQNLQKTPTDLLAVASTCGQELSAKAAEKQVALTVSGASALINGAPALLHELAFNLMDNAISYNRPGGKVEVAVTHCGGAAVLMVKDNGMGIPAQHQPRVFERFYRVDKSRSRATGGTGLGLSIVKHAAALHGAEVTLTSEEGKGTTVTVTFPQ